MKKPKNMESNPKSHLTSIRVDLSRQLGPIKSYPGFLCWKPWFGASFTIEPSQPALYSSVLQAHHRLDVPKIVPLIRVHSQGKQNKHCSLNSSRVQSQAIFAWLPNPILWAHNFPKFTTFQVSFETVSLKLVVSSPSIDWLTDTAPSPTEANHDHHRWTTSRTRHDRRTTTKLFTKESNVNERKNERHSAQQQHMFRSNPSSKSSDTTTTTADNIEHYALHARRRAMEKLNCIGPQANIQYPMCPKALLEFLPTIQTHTQVRTFLVHQSTQYSQDECGARVPRSAHHIWVKWTCSNGFRIQREDEEEEKKPLQKSKWILRHSRGGVARACSMFMVDSNNNNNIILIHSSWPALSLLTRRMNEWTANFVRQWLFPKSISRVHPIVETKQTSKTEVVCFVRCLSSWGKGENKFHHH